MTQMNLSLKQKHKRTDLLPRWSRGVGAMDWEFGVGRQMQTIPFRMDKQGDLMHSTENYIQSPGVNHNGKECFKKNIYMCKKKKFSHFQQMILKLILRPKKKIFNLYTYIYTYSCIYIHKHIHIHISSLIAQLVKNPPAVQETPVQFLGQEDPLEKG